jgi:hypothetical protein
VYIRTWPGSIGTNSSSWPLIVLCRRSGVI